jgi:hypothetical protein
MAESGLFIGFGHARMGREAAARKVLGETLAYFGRLRDGGEIETFETVVLGYNLSELAGFFLLRGDPEQLARLSLSAEFSHCMNRAEAVTERLGIVPAALDEAVMPGELESYEVARDLF